MFLSTSYLWWLFTFDTTDFPCPNVFGFSLAPQSFRWHPLETSWLQPREWQHSLLVITRISHYCYAHNFNFLFPARFGDNLGFPVPGGSIPLQACFMVSISKHSLGGEMSFAQVQFHNEAQKEVLQPSEHREETGKGWCLQSPTALKWLVLVVEDMQRLS